MIGLNRVQLIGFLGGDPELKQTPIGKVCKFSVAVSRRWRDKDGNQIEDTEWFNIEARDRLGEICQEYLKKGSLIFLEGRLKTDRYEKDGQTHYYTKVIASQMQMLDRKKQSSE